MESAAIRPSVLSAGSSPMPTKIIVGSPCIWSCEQRLVFSCASVLSLYMSTSLIASPTFLSSSCSKIHGPHQSARMSGMSACAPTPHITQAHWQADACACLHNVAAVSELHNDHRGDTLDWNSTCIKVYDHGPLALSQLDFKLLRADFLNLHDPMTCTIP